jgi:transcriptional regulator with XRE-family HTH domain
MPRDAVPGFSTRLQALRVAKGLTQQQLADAAETHPDSIVKLEKGTRQPSLELAWRLARALGVEVTEFLPKPEGKPQEGESSAGKGKRRSPSSG